MPRQRPPVTDAEFRIVHGPWPRWMLHLSLIKLAAFGAAVTAVCVIVGVMLLVMAGAFH